ncbi:MAG: hypothetical protein JXA37_12050 [Chloroflexia bacterium]|nr:hypothetical protein [Chloroflexia bacterium]
MEKIEELFLNGIAAAKGGNRRLAQAFFKRVIKENPYHESAWIWLSEMLDDPEDIAYCLESALAINPHNEKARLSLELVQDRRGDKPSRPQEWSSLGELLDMDLPTILSETPSPTTPKPPAEPLVYREPDHQGVWRAVLFAGVVVAVLILAVIFAKMPLQPDNPGTGPTNRPSPTIDLTALPNQERPHILIYFNQLDSVLGPLRLAHDIYKGQSNQRVSLADQVSYTNRLRAQVVAALETLQQVEPPTVLAKAHGEYLHGLSLEQEALDNLLRYFETSQAGYSNRATVKMQEAGFYMDQAKAVWEAYRAWVGLAEPTRMPTPSPRSAPTFGPTPSITPTFRPEATATPSPLPTEPIGQ